MEYPVINEFMRGKCLDAEALIRQDDLPPTDEELAIDEALGTDVSLAPRRRSIRRDGPIAVPGAIRHLRSSEIIEQTEREYTG